jgi:hypothetical protein
MSARINIFIRISFANEIFRHRVLPDTCQGPRKTSRFPLLELVKCLNSLGQVGYISERLGGSMVFRLIIAFAVFIHVQTFAFANDAVVNESSAVVGELNPYREYESKTGQSPWLEYNFNWSDTCYRDSCPVWIRINRAEQTLYLYEDGLMVDRWLVSTGLPRTPTPSFDRHPNGRVYDRYTSTKFPGGDWKGLGNMPYAVFIQGGFAIHGTPRENWHRLGKRASHGCIRLHPDNALYFNRLVRQYGIQQVWITVE